MRGTYTFFICVVLLVCAMWAKHPLLQLFWLISLVFAMVLLKPLHNDEEDKAIEEEKASNELENYPRPNFDYDSFTKGGKK